MTITLDLRKMQRATIIHWNGSSGKASPDDGGQVIRLHRNHLNTLFPKITTGEVHSAYRAKSTTPWWGDRREPEGMKIYFLRQSDDPEVVDHTSAGIWVTSKEYCEVLRKITVYRVVSYDYKINGEWPGTVDTIVDTGCLGMFEIDLKKLRRGDEVPYLMYCETIANGVRFSCRHRWERHDPDPKKPGEFIWRSCADPRDTALLRGPVAAAVQAKAETKPVAQVKVPVQEKAKLKHPHDWDRNRTILDDWLETGEVPAII